MIISREDMAELIHTGHAQPWTHELGPDRTVWVAARVWYAVLEGAEGYSAAAGPLAAALNTAQDVFSLPSPQTRRISGVLTQVKDAMAGQTSAQSGPAAGVLSRESMAEHLDNGFAEPWTQDLGPSDAPLAARVWYFVVAGENVYRPAPKETAAVLDGWRASFVEAERQQEEAGRRMIREAARLS